MHVNQIRTPGLDIWKQMQDQFFHAGPRAFQIKIAGNNERPHAVSRYLHRTIFKPSTSHWTSKRLDNLYISGVAALHVGTIKSWRYHEGDVPISPTRRTMLFIHTTIPIPMGTMK